jgi:tetratricopeptide (TPR) repeat protein
MNPNNECQSRLLKRSAGDTLFAFYDLQICTVTFDFFTFLLRAEIARRDGDFAQLHIVFVPGADDGFRMMHHSGAVSGWRLRNILVAGCTMLPSVRSVTVCESREQAAEFEGDNPETMFPTGYTTRIVDSQTANDAAIDAFMFAGLAALHIKGVEIPNLVPSNSAKDWTRAWLETRTEGRKPVVITLRESPFDPARNSRLDEWAAFADGLDLSEFCPVFVRDTDAVFTAIPPQLRKFSICNRASLEVDIRMALYEAAYANLLVNNGPLAFCYLNPRVRYLVFKHFNAAQGEDEKATFAVYGIAQFGQTPMATPFQLNVWQDDRCNGISEAFEELSGRIEAATAAGTLGRSDCRGTMSTANAIASATAMHSVGRYDAAASIYEHLSEVEPDHPDIAGMLGLARHHQGRRDDAIAHLQRAISLSPTSHIHWFNLGVVYREAGDIERAISAFEKVLEINPEIRGAHENLGDIFAKHEDWKQAARHYTLAIELHADDMTAYSKLARCLEGLGRKAEAYELYRRAGAAEKTRLTERDDAKRAEISALNKIHPDMHPYYVLPRTGRDLEDRLAL